MRGGMGGYPVPRVRPDLYSTEQSFLGCTWLLADDPGTSYL